MKRICALAALLLLTVSAYAQGGAAGTVINNAVNCATSADGTVVGVGNPLTNTNVTTSFSGTLTPGTYYTAYTFFDFLGHETLASPEATTVLSGTGALVVAPPTGGIPQNVAGMRVYIGTASGTETLQGATAGTASFVQSSPLATGAALPASNTTVCKIVANDAIWPTGTGYRVSLTDPSGNSLPGYPMLWQLMGPGTNINIANGLPYYHGTVMYPTPILASPLNHATQSIAGPLSLGTYPLYAQNIYLGPNKIPVGITQHSYGTTGCATSGTAGATCITTVVWNTPFADTNYSVVCSGDGITSGIPVDGGLSLKLTNGLHHRTVAATNAAAQYTTIECIAVHD